jgi:protein phosphatase
MGTTLVAMLLLEQRYWLVHVGDSRCYRSKREGMQALTRDHSLVQELLDQGSITEQEAERVPFRNMLTRAVGPDSDVSFSLACHLVQADESWLLCSDGLYNTLSDTVINRWMQSGLSAEETAQALVQESLRHHARDNVSVIVLKQNTANRSKQYGDLSAAGG